MDEGGRGGGRGRLRWSPALTLAALGAVLATLLWLVALASHDRSPEAAGQARGPLVASPRLVAATYLLLLMLGMVQLILLVVQTLRRRLRSPVARRSPWRGLRWVAGLVLLCFLLANLALPNWLGLRPGSGQGGPEAPDATVAGGGAAAGRSPTAVGAGLVAFVLLLLALAAVVAARRHHRATPRAQLAGELSELVERSLAELEAERDPRRAVIAAYAGMEQTLAASGVPRTPAEAPLEYLARAVGSRSRIHGARHHPHPSARLEGARHRSMTDSLVELQVDAAAAGRLTELFQRARFSRHEVGEAMKREAIEALAAVRDELRAAAQAGGGSGGLESEAGTRAADDHLGPSGSPPVHEEPAAPVRPPAEERR